MPVSALKKAIDGERERHLDRDVSNSLIVLPEAFNTGGKYTKPASPLPARRILEELHSEVAAPLRLALVVGMLHQGRNSAYWVDANGPELICHKMGDDQVGPYDPCLDHPDECNPVICSNARVGTLICMDATDGNEPIEGRRNNIVGSLKQGTGNKILCVPARFSVSGPDPLLFLPQLPDYWYVVADGTVRGRSFVAHAVATESNNSSGARKIEATAPEGNAVKLWPLPQASVDASIT